MGTRMLTMLLILAILYLMLPATENLFLAEQAFTPDNLVRIEVNAD